MYVVTVLFKAHAAHWTAFRAAMHENAATTLAVEAGCRQFDVCEGEEGSHTIFLYEVYDTEADFKAHLAAPHFLTFDSNVASWVASKQVQIYSRASLQT